MWPSINEVVPGVYIGDANGAENETLLKKVYIQHVVTLLDQNDMRSFCMFDQIVYHLYQFDDGTGNIIQIGQEVYDIIEECQQNGDNILIHCALGISRSAAVVIYYLMRKQGRTYRKARKFLKWRRRIICPAHAYVAQLRTLETTYIP